MEAPRARVGSLLEWLLAAGCLAAVLSLGSLVVREFHTVSAVTPVIANEAPVRNPPAAVPSRAVSVPLLLLDDGTQIRVGDTVEAAQAVAGAAAEVTRPNIDRTESGERVTRTYERNGTRFVLVFEPSADDHQFRVTGIYLP